MNLADARIVLRQRGRLEILDPAFRYVLGEAGRSMTLLVALTLLPAFGAIVSARALLAMQWWQVWILALVLGTLLSGVFTVASGTMLFDRKLHVRTVLRDYGRRLPRFVAALFVSRLMIAVGTLLIVPGIMAWVRHVHVGEVVLLERVPIRRVFSRSTALSREAGGGAFGLLVSIGLMSALLVIGTETIALSMLEDVLVLPVKSERLLLDGGSYPAIAGFLLSVPWAAASRFLAYIDGRTRQDAWDVQIRLMALGEGAT